MSELFDVGNRLTSGDLYEVVNGDTRWLLVKVDKTKEDKMKENMSEASGVYDRPRRSENDLDSIEVGSPLKGGKLKLYFNTREDTKDDIEVRIDLLMSAIKYTNKELLGDDDGG